MATYVAETCRRHTVCVYNMLPYTYVYLVVLVSYLIAVMDHLKLSTKKFPEGGGLNAAGA
jgi:hypothetical protein